MAVRERFVILAAPRSGSNMLCTMLESHPDIRCHHEIYNPKGIRLALPLREAGVSLGTVEERERDPEAFLERVWASGDGACCVGFKLTHRQNDVVYRRLLADASIAKVVLRRRNRLKTYVSALLSEARNRWEVYDGDEPCRDHLRVTVDPAAFLEHAAFDAAYYDELRAAFEAGAHPRIEVCYEDLFSLRAQNAVLGFLGVAGTVTGLEARSVKQNARDLRLTVENYGSLRDVFDGTEFEAELRSLGD